MNPNQPDLRTTQPPPRDAHAKRLQAGTEGDDLDLFPWLATLWDGRVPFFASFLLLLTGGIFYAWWAPPVYQAEAMLQIQAKKERPADSSLSKMESLFSEPASAHSEIEIIRSNLVLSRTIEALGLDIKAEPILMPILGAPRARRDAMAPILEVGTMVVPNHMRGAVFHITALSNGAFRWDDPNGGPLAQGKAMEPLAGTYQGEPVSLQVNRLSAKPGQAFKLSLVPLQDAIDELRENLDVSERGKLTNILGLTLRGPNPGKCVAILNTIVDQYAQHNQERRSSEIAKAQAVLGGKMPELKAQLELAESRLNQFRSRSGSVDLSREADTYILQSSGLASQVSALKQKRQELLRTYTENADVVTTIDQQIAKLQQELGQVDSKVRILPGLQQEVVRLSRDVQVATELYTSLLNNLQQLQITGASNLANVSVVDRATANPDPIAPRKSVVVLFFAFLGLGCGISMVSLQKALRRGIEDHRIIETKMGLPVFVTVPHSKAQRAHEEAMHGSTEGLHLLASQNPGDLAVESLRSLRTMLNFYIKDAANPVVLMSGPSPRIGKSFISANFATVLAQAGSTVLLIDGDLRKGKLHKYFGVKNRLNGLSDVLSGQKSWAAVLQQVGISGLDLISTGLLPPNPSDLLMSSRLTDFIEQVSKQYDFIIIDAPPVLPVTDATILGSHAGTVLLVAKFGEHPIDEMRTARKRFESQGIQVKGCVFNDIKPVGWGNNYRRYNYIYGYGIK